MDSYITALDAWYYENATNDCLRASARDSSESCVNVTRNYGSLKCRLQSSNHIGRSVFPSLYYKTKGVCLLYLYKLLLDRENARR